MRSQPPPPSRSISGRTTFLVNPASENGATGRRWPEIANRAAAVGVRGDALLSEGPGDLTALARKAVDDGAELLVAVGGDGTVNEVVNGIAGRDSVELAVIPFGTGWDFVRTYGIPRSLDEALHVMQDGRLREIDVGRASFRSWEGQREERYFANIASAGMSGAIAHSANTTTKLFGGRLSYLWATATVFARSRPRVLEVDVDGERRRGPMYDVIVANGSYLAGGMHICPDAKPDDELFDVLLIKDIGKLDLARTMPKAYLGRHLPHPKAEVIRGATVTVRTDTALRVELDGEQPGTTPARFEVVPAALRLRVP